MIDALFFNREADLFGYTPAGELFAINKIEGNLHLIQRGPQGSHVDGCACSYTYEFDKEIIPRKILPCEEFQINYHFTNHLGLSQTGIKLRDTFPEDFEIVDISGGIAYTLTNQETPKNILALDNMIYQMGENSIVVTINPAASFLGQFSSQAIQEPFSISLGPFHLSDDPLSEAYRDPSSAEIVNSNSLHLKDYISYNCEGNLAILTAPGEASSYEWSNGVREKQIQVSSTGWYSLKMESDCFLYIDSIYIDEFPEKNFITIGEDQMITLGDSILLSVVLNTGIAESIQWFMNGEEMPCRDCLNQWLAPEEDSYIKVLAVASKACILEDEIYVEVEYYKNVYVPNVFSPNGDGFNDNFFISSSLPGHSNMYVYNRWGNLVFTRNNAILSNASEGWDGTINGEFVGIGTYVWKADINYINGTSEFLSGNVLVLSNN